MIKILLDNGYSLNFIFDIIRKNIKVLINKKIFNQTINNNNDSSNKDKKKKRVDSQFHMYSLFPKNLKISSKISILNSHFSAITNLV